MGNGSQTDRPRGQRSNKDVEDGSSTDRRPPESVMPASTHRSGASKSESVFEISILTPDPGTSEKSGGGARTSRPSLANRSVEGPGPRSEAGSVPAKTFTMRSQAATVAGNLSSRKDNSDELLDRASNVFSLLHGASLQANAASPSQTSEVETPRNRRDMTGRGWDRGSNSLKPRSNQWPLSRLSPTTNLAAAAAA